MFTCVLTVAGSAGVSVSVFSVSSLFVSVDLVMFVNIFAVLLGIIGDVAWVVADDSLGTACLVTCCMGAFGAVAVAAYNNWSAHLEGPGACDACGLVCAIL